VCQFFTRLNVSHGDENDLALHADIGIARVIAEDHLGNYDAVCTTIAHLGFVEDEID
jgi:hypothetical protein